MKRKTNNMETAIETLKGEQLVCPVCKSRRIKQDPKWEDNECLNCKRIWAN